MNAAVCIHCDGWSCARCERDCSVVPVTDHDRPEDLELEALKEQLRRVSFERNAYRHLLAQIAINPLESFAVEARNILSQFPKAVPE